MECRPRSGIFATAWRTSVLIRPAIAKVSPSLRLILVAAWFFRITGMLKPDETRPWLKSRLETSGRILGVIVSPSTHHRREERGHAELLELDGGAVVVLSDRVQGIHPRR